jgi:hypothetical protein
METPIKEKLLKYFTFEGEFSFIIDDNIYVSKPIMPLNKFFNLLTQQFDEINDAPLLDLLLKPEIAVFGGAINYLEKIINIKTALKKIKTDLTRNLKSTVQEYMALINLFDKLEVKDVIRLSEEGISFYFTNQRLYAIKYLPIYIQEYQGIRWKFPGCTIGIYLDNELRFGESYILKPKGYIHPFVFRDGPPYKICLGTFYDSKESKTVKSLEFVNSLIMYFASAVQILVSGYDRNVNPANHHLTDSIYDKYKLK